MAHASEILHVPDLLGGLTIKASGDAIRAIRFGFAETAGHPGPLVREAERQLREYFEGARHVFDLRLEPEGTPFQKQVWRALCEIPYGATRSYRDIATAVARPNGFQAIGQANTRNPIAIVIPCHRVINADGSMGGYGGGLERKQNLLLLERKHAQRFRETAA